MSRCTPSAIHGSGKLGRPSSVYSRHPSRLGCSGATTNTAASYDEHMRGADPGGWLPIAASPSNRVDGLSLSLEPSEVYSAYSSSFIGSSARAPSWTSAGVEPCSEGACAFACTNCGGAADADALLASVGDGNSLGGEPFCWCCLGFGHTKNKDGQHWCRSESRKRLPADAIAALSSRALQFNQGNSFQRRPSWVRTG